MAQADPITTATGEGVSRGGSRKSTSLRSAHTQPAAALGDNPTHADRIDKAFAALHLYVTALFSDTAKQIPGCSLNRKHLNKLFVDLQSEAVAVIRNAPEDLRNHENWKVS
jgi:hypothetical protein